MSQQTIYVRRQSTRLCIKIATDLRTIKTDQQLSIGMNKYNRQLRIRRRKHPMYEVKIKNRKLRIGIKVKSTIFSIAEVKVQVKKLTSRTSYYRYSRLARRRSQQLAIGSNVNTIQHLATKLHGAHPTALDARFHGIKSRLHHRSVPIATRVCSHFAVVT